MNVFELAFVAFTLFLGYQGASVLGARIGLLGWAIGGAMGVGTSLALLWGLHWLGGRFRPQRPL